MEIFIFFKIIIILFIYYSFSKYNNADILNYPIFQIDEYKEYFDEINKNCFSYIFRSKPKIENIFLLFVILPFLKKEVHISKHIYIHNFLKQVFDHNNNEKIIISNNSVIDISNYCRKILYYNWEFLPSKNKTNYIRHILYHYYPDDCLDAYEESLNMNIKNYFEQNKENVDYNQIKDLMSKN